MILEYFGENFSDMDCNSTCDNCRRGANKEIPKAKKVNFDNLIKSILDTFTNQSTKMTFIQLIEALKGRSAQRYRSLPFFAEGKSFSESTLRQILFKLLEKSFLKEKPKSVPFKKRFTYEVLELFKPLPRDYTLDLMVSEVFSKAVHLNEENSFQMQQLLGQTGRGKLSFISDYYNTASEKLRTIRKEFYHNCVQKDMKLRTLFEENNFTVDNLIPSHILRELCRILPESEAELHQLVIFPKEFCVLEKKVIECSREIVKQFNLKKEDRIRTNNQLAPIKKNPDVSEEVFQVNNLSFLDKENDSLSDEDAINDEPDLKTGKLDEEKANESPQDSSAYSEEEDDMVFELNEDLSRASKKTKRTVDTFAEEFSTHLI